MNHPESPQPDPNDPTPDVPPAENGRRHGPEVHFGQILSNVEGQLDQLHRVQREMDEHNEALDDRARQIAARDMQTGGSSSGEDEGGEEQEATPGDDAAGTAADPLEARRREAEERYARLVDEQEAFDTEREAWLERQREAESQLREREEELARQETEFVEEREQLAAIAARVAEERARQLQTQETGGRAEELTQRCEELEQQVQVERGRAEQAEAAAVERAQEVQNERDAARAELAAAQERLAALEQQIAEGAAKPAAPTDMGSDVRLRAMKKKIQKLEALLAEKHPQLANAPSHQEQLDGLRRKAERLSDVAEHLRRRHYRLRHVRELLRKEKKRKRPRAVSEGPDPRRVAAAAEEHAARVRTLEAQRVAIGEKAAALADTERRMVRRWATVRAIVLVGWIVAVGVVAAAASWLAASQIMPPERSASVTLDARTRGRAALTEEEAANWRAWHTQIVSEDNFLDAMIVRLDERQIETFPDKTALAERLARDLTFAAVDDDTLMLTLSGTDPDEITTLLDIVASTIVVESSRLIRKRTADPWATLGGASVDLNPTPVRDQRLPWAGGIFGGLYVLLLLLGIVIYSRLIRVKRELDADGSLFDEIKPLSDGAVQKVNVI